MSEVPTEKPVKNRKKYVLIAVAVVLVLYSPMFLMWAHQIQFVFHLLFGWVIHLKATALPALLGNAASLWFPVLCLLIAGWLGHRFVRWWSGERGFVWKGRQTVCVFALLLLGSAAAIAMSGVAHQLAWMGSTKMTRSSFNGDMVSQINDFRNLMLAVMEYEDVRGEYPDTLEQLAELDIFYPETLHSMIHSGKPYYGPRERVHYRKPVDETDALPILIGSVYGSKVVCGFLDGTVRWMELREYEAMMDTMERRGK